jgi:branched-chain amino acid transport system permease protein
MLAEIISGLSIGSMYVLLALGFSLCLGVGDMVNLAHGATVVAGMYVVFAFVTSLGMGTYIAVVLAAVICAVLSLLVYFVAIAPSQKTGGGHNPQIVYTLVISSLLAVVFQLIFGGGLLGLPFSEASPWSFFGVTIDPARVVAFVVAMVTSVSFVIWLRYSFAGKLLRMTGKYTEGAYAIGIPVRQVFIVIFCLGGAMAGLAGGLLMTVLPVTPTLGLDFLIIALIVSIAGRLSLIWVSVVSLVYGVAQSILNRLLDTPTAATIIFAAFLAVLALERIISTRSKVRRA